MMTNVNQQGKRTENSEGKNDVKPILLQESLFRFLHDGIARRGQRGRNAKLWSIKGAPVRSNLK
jgi:hypothetical protein